MTKEEIIKKYEPFPNKAEVNVIGTMMDEYAKQQAIAFFTWHANKLIQFEVQMSTPQPNGIDLWKEMRHFEAATIEDRFKLFIEQQNKDNGSINNK